jgi:hypothetical protein
MRTIGIVAGHPTKVVVRWFAVVAMLIDLGEEIAADAMDCEGDKLIGSRSLAIVLGRRQVLRVSAGIFGLVALVSLIPFPCRWLEPIHLLPMRGSDPPTRTRCAREWNTWDMQARPHPKPVGVAAPKNSARAAERRTILGIRSWRQRPAASPPRRGWSLGHQGRTPVRAGRAEVGAAIGASCCDLRRCRGISADGSRETTPVPPAGGGSRAGRG